MSQLIVRNVEMLNIRSEPKMVRDNVVGVLMRDEVVDLLGVSGTEYWYQIRRADGLTGWSSHKFLFPVVPKQEQPGDPPWLAIALGEVGVKEWPGIVSANPRIVGYLQSTTLPPAMAANDQTDWCSAFVNWCVEQAGIEGTDSAAARSWFTWGRAITAPVRGCIAVFERPEGGAQAGHVGFYMGETTTKVKVLGGNQTDEVNIGTQLKDRLLGYRLAFV